MRQLVKHSDNINTVHRNKLYFSWRNPATGEDICMKRERARKEGHKNKWRNLNTFKTYKDSDPFIRIHLIDPNTYTVLDGEFSEDFILVSTSANYEVFSDHSLLKAFNDAEICRQDMEDNLSEDDVLAQMSDIEDEREKIAKREKELNTLEGKLQTILVGKIAKRLGKPLDALKVGVHLCSKVNAGTCVYDLEEDPAKDECLICGMPHERK